MKLSKIPGLGRFGVFIDDVDLNTVTNEQWLEIGEIHLKSLVTIIRNTQLTDPVVYDRLVAKFGPSRMVMPHTFTSPESHRFFKKYGIEIWDVTPEKLDMIDQEDKKWITFVKHLPVDGLKSILKVSGKRNEQGESLGMFSEGELLWHSNESGRLTFTPGVSLLGSENMIGSSTGFITTTDWYESQTESFRSELDEMVILHRFTPGKINPGAPEEQDWLMHKNMCPFDDSEIPLVIQSPGGIRGLHYSINTVSHVKGMTIEQSQKLFEKINNELFVDQYVYDYWYQNNDDLCLFDNSITLHRRLGDISGRLAWRIQYDFNQIQKEPYCPYFQSSFRKKYIEEMQEVLKMGKLTDQYTLPTP